MVSGGVPYSMPRLPGPYGVDGGRNGSRTGASTGGAYTTSGPAGPDGAFLAAAGAAPSTKVQMTMTATMERVTKADMGAPRRRVGT